MKTCPYCAEEIHDAAIKCRYCQSWLVDEVPTAAVTPPAGMGQAPSAALSATEPETAEGVAPADPGPADTLAVTVPEPASASSTGPAEASIGPAEATAPAEKVEFTHSGERYLLGYTDDSFGIWDRQSPAAPTERMPRTDAGWSQIWQRYVALESNWMDLRTGQRSP